MTLLHASFLVLSRLCPDDAIAGNRVPIRRKTHPELSYVCLTNTNWGAIHEVEMDFDLR